MASQASVQLGLLFTSCALRGLQLEIIILSSAAKAIRVSRKLQAQPTSLSVSLVEYLEEGEEDHG